MYDHVFHWNDVTLGEPLEIKKLRGFGSFSGDILPTEPRYLTNTNDGETSAPTAVPQMSLTVTPEAPRFAKGPPKTGGGVTAIKWGDKNNRNGDIMGL